jgi:chromosome segregation ATPase
MDEEVVLLEEQLAAAHADIERLQARLAESEARSATREADALELKRRLDTASEQAAERDSALSAQEGEIEALRERLDTVSTRSQADAQRYRGLVLAHEPDLPADLVAGASIEALDEAVLQARQTVARVRQHLEEQARSQRVPAGAPVRAAPDLSVLSPAEKIRQGLREG